MSRLLKFVNNLLENIDRLSENSKSEILALKGRLQAAVTHAKEAEKAQFTTSRSGSGSGSGTVM
jgi:hypothetical protein